MIKYLDIVDKNICSGCGACSKSCPFDAIAIKEDEYGFIFPFVDEEKCTQCGLCRKTCPVNNVKFHKKPEKCYAAMADDKIRAISSSGGIFTVIAEHILQNGGLVCGAAFDSNWNVHHIIIDKKEDLGKLRSSKYVQSNLEDTYIEAKKYLDAGKLLLFSGTPCQIAGLYGFLKKDYDNLLTIDLICHGAPNSKLWQKCLADICNVNEIADINFRDKSAFGWVCANVNITLNNGTKVSKKSYMNAFSYNLMNRESCTNCKYKTYERCADITLGDFWGISNFNPALNDKKGTSIVLLNTHKAKTFLNLGKILEQLPLFTEFEYKNITNSVSKDFAHFHRNYFLKEIFNGNKSFDETVKRWLKDSHDVGLVGFYSGMNYGTYTTYYSLYHTINSLGYSVLMIDNPLSAAWKPKWDLVLFRLNPYPDKNRAKHYKNKYELRKLNKYVDNFIVGSDQYLRNGVYKLIGEYTSLDWVYDYKPKNAYSISFGEDYFEGNENDRSKMACFLKKFDNVSVRENGAIKMCKDNFGIDAEYCLDPVFLPDKKYYSDLIARSKLKPKEKYILAYFLDDNKEKQDIFSLFAKSLNLETEFINDPIKERENNRFKVYTEDWLNYYKNAEFVITDSFHGVCMALVFGKQFAFFHNKRRGASRFNTLIENFNIGSRAVNSVEDVENIIQNPLNYDEIDKKINFYKEKSLNYLKKILEEKPRKPASDYDILMDENIKLYDELNRLNEKINNAKGIDTANLNKELKQIKEYIKYSKHAEKYKLKYMYYRLIANFCKGSLKEKIKEKKKKNKDILNILDKSFSIFSSN